MPVCMTLNDDVVVMIWKFVDSLALESSDVIVIYTFCGDRSLFLRLVISTVRYSDGPLFLRFDIPTRFCGEGWPPWYYHGIPGSTTAYHGGTIVRRGTTMVVPCCTILYHGIIWPWYTILYYYGTAWWYHRTAWYYHSSTMLYHGLVLPWNTILSYHGIAWWYHIVRHGTTMVVPGCTMVPPWYAVALPGTMVIRVGISNRRNNGPSKKRAVEISTLTPFCYSITLSKLFVSSPFDIVVLLVGISSEMYNISLLIPVSVKAMKVGFPQLVYIEHIKSDINVATVALPHYPKQSETAWISLQISWIAFHSVKIMVCRP